MSRSGLIEYVSLAYRMAVNFRRQHHRIIATNQRRTCMDKARTVARFRTLFVPNRLVSSAAGSPGSGAIGWRQSPAWRRISKLLNQDLLGHAALEKPQPGSIRRERNWGAFV